MATFFEALGAVAADVDRIVIYRDFKDRFGVPCFVIEANWKAERRPFGLSLMVPWNKAFEIEAIHSLDFLKRQIEATRRDNGVVCLGTLFEPKRGASQG